jgi:BA14K-like protein
MSCGSRLNLAVAILAIGVGVGVATAEAMPLVNGAPGVASTAAVGTAPAVEKVQYRRRGYYGRGGYGLPLLGAGIIAGAIIADRAYRPRYRYYDAADYDGPYYRPTNYQGSDRQLCAENFRSFEWRTGLYTTYGGEKRLCPYLR